MRILILGFTKMKFMPYINFYLSNINAKKHEVHVVYWNRDKKTEDISAYDDLILHEFSCYQEDDVPKIKKIKSFFKYRMFAKSIIKQIKFDKIIVLHTLPGIILYDMLYKYKGEFILDYRDSTYENFNFFKKLVANLVNWSEITFVSSDAFRKYLPENQKDKIFTSHNILTDSLKHQEDRENCLVKSDKIRLAFWGFIRHEDINRSIISSLANDSRYELHYYGREQHVASILKSYALSLNASNVFFHGEYIPEDRYEFIKNTDCIHNLYDDANTMLAMGNKYYDGIIFRIPQVCMPSSYMGQMCIEHKVGVSLNPKDASFADDLYEYLTTLDYDNFKINCKKELDRILAEYKQGIVKISSIWQN